MKYEFKNVEEFVSYLDSSAKMYRASAEKTNPRAHKYASLQASAVSYEAIASMVRNSNLVAIVDYAAVADVITR